MINFHSNPFKYNLFNEKVIYFVHVISDKTVKTSSEKISIIKT